MGKSETSEQTAAMVAALAASDRINEMGEALWQFAVQHTAAPLTEIRIIPTGSMVRTIVTCVGERDLRLFR